MPTINQLPLRSPVSPGDQIPIYSPNNGDARRTPVSAVADLIVNGLDLPNTAVLLTGDQTVGGTKTFSNAIVGSITGNAGTVTNGVYTTGNQTIGGIKTFSNAIVGDVTGNAGSVTNGVYTTGNQTIGGTKTFSSAIVGDITGNAGTVTNGVYTTGNQTIGGTKTFSSAIVGDVTGNAGTATTATTATTASSVTNGVYTVGDQTIGGTKTFSVNPILSAGTVNTILTLDGSKQISAVSGLTWDSTKSNLSLGGVTVGQGNVPSLNNIAFGSNALNAITTGYRNLGVGNDTLKVVTTGYNNLAIGPQSGQSLTTGFDNVFIGSGAGRNATTPRQNIAIGTAAAINLTTGQDNVAVGAGAGYDLSVGSGNTFIGTGAGTRYTGSFSVFIGGAAGGTLNGNGAWNTCVGVDAGGSGGTSSYNTCIGFEAGKSLVNSGANTFVGVNAGDQINVGQGNTVIGRFNGNQSSLDVRLTDYNIVLSDGLGRPRAYYLGPSDAWVWRTGASERLWITSAGNVGIGTGTPGTLLTVNGVASFSAGTAAAPALTTIGDLDTGVWFPAANTWAVATGASERMRITSGGNVVVGSTATIGGNMSVWGGLYLGANDSTAELQHYRASDNSGAAFSYLNKARGTIASPTVVQSGDGLGSMVWRGYDGATYAQAAIIRAEVDGTPGSGDMPGRLVFATTLDGASTATERMRIDSSGNVGIGTTSPAVKLEVAGQIRTEAPTGGTAANWRLGTVHTVSPTSPNRTIEVDIGGTIYYLHAKTTNN